MGTVFGGIGGHSYGPVDDAIIKRHMDKFNSGKVFSKEKALKFNNNKEQEKEMEDRNIFTGGENVFNSNFDKEVTYTIYPQQNSGGIQSKISLTFKKDSVCIQQGDTIRICLTRNEAHSLFQILKEEFHTGVVYRGIVDDNCIEGGITLK